MLKAPNLVIFSSSNLVPLWAPLKLIVDRVKFLWNGMNNILRYVAIIHKWGEDMVGMKLSGYVQILYIACGCI